MQHYYKDKCVAITGATGFVGKHLVAALERQGAHIFSLPSRRLYDLRNSHSAMAFCRDAISRLGRIDVLFHIAGVVSGIGHTAANPVDHLYDNTIMGLNLLRSAHYYNALNTVVVGSVCAYPENTPVPFQEDQLWSGYPEPTNGSYGIAKRTILAMQQAYHKQFSMPSAHLLMANMYGPGDNFRPETSHVIPALISKIHSISTYDPLQVWGTGNATRDFLFISDAIDAILMAGERLHDPQPINIARGQATSIAALAHMISAKMGHLGEITFTTGKPDGQKHRLLSTKRAEEKLQWKAQVAIPEGLTQTISWYRTQYQNGAFRTPLPPTFMASDETRKP